MSENTNELFSSIIAILTVLCICAVIFWIAYTLIQDRITPIKTGKAQVVDKLGRQRSLRGSKFSYEGYTVGEQGRSSKLVDFH